MIPRLKPALGWEELAAAFRLPLGRDVGQFERAFAVHMGRMDAVAFPYGRTALLCLLEAMGIRDREVICPAYTCVVVPHAIVSSGNLPVFVDSQESDFNMDLSLLDEAINDRTGAIVATSLFGYPVDLDRLDEIRHRHPHVRIIQDCCHSFSCEWKGRPVVHDGDAAFFGMNISKLMTSIFGGMVTSNDEQLAARLRLIRDEQLTDSTLFKSLRRLAYLLAVYPAFAEPFYGLTNALERSGLLGGLVDYYDESIIDLPDDHRVKMCKLEARVGLAQLGKIDGIIAHRRRLAAEYDKELGGVNGLRLPPLVPGATYSHYVPRVASRDAVIGFAREQGVQLGRLIEYCIPEMKAYRDRKFISRGVAPRLKKETLNLPVHGSIGNFELDMIVDVLKEALVRV
jgi:dTDP-4-amino-4,6-dideoxygalactose transaminase